MSKIRVAARSGFEWFFAFVLASALAGSTSQAAAAGTSVVAWGAGKTVNIGSTNDYGQSIVPQNLTNAVQVAGGWWHSIAVKADGTVQGWGDDRLGQLDLPAASNYVAVACGDWFTAALMSNGTVAAVGDNYNDFGERNVPGDLSNAVFISCGFYHCLALKSDGTLADWGGENEVDYGQGTGTIPDGLSNVVAIAAGGLHNLVLKSDGSLLAWGSGEFGETNIPTGLSHVVAIAAGGYHNLVLEANGKVVAWGANNYGQTNVPSNLSNVVAIAAGQWHSLALKDNGTVIAWGLDTEGDTNVPANLTNVVQIAAGDFHCLALVRTNLPPTRTVVLRPKVGTNGFSVSVPTQNGRVYQLQYKDALTDGVWQSLPLQAGTGGNLQLTDPAVTPRRFYRVERW